VQRRHQRTGAVRPRPRSFARKPHSIFTGSPHAGPMVTAATSEKEEPPCGPV
jgi:hypothetical protein